jgi:agmatinase
MRRCLESPNVKLISLGARSTSKEEIEFMKKNKSRINTFYAKDKETWDLKKIQKLIKNKNVYISFDVDVFDSSLMPATGTPEPGGLFWNEVINLIKMTSKNSNVVGADITELAPIKNMDSYNFTVAKLTYRLISIIFNSKKV